MESFCGSWPCRTNEGTTSMITGIKRRVNRRKESKHTPSLNTTTIMPVSCSSPSHQNISNPLSYLPYSIDSINRNHFDYTQNLRGLQDSLTNPYQREETRRRLQRSPYLATYYGNYLELQQHRKNLKRNQARLTQAIEILKMLQQFQQDDINWTQHLLDQTTLCLCNTDTPERVQVLCRVRVWSWHDQIELGFSL